MFKHVVFNKSLKFCSIPLFLLTCLATLHVHVQTTSSIPVEPGLEKVLSTPCYTRRVTAALAILWVIRQTPLPVSQQVWHYKDPSLLQCKGVNCAILRRQWWCYVRTRRKNINTEFYNWTCLSIPFHINNSIECTQESFFLSVYLSYGCLSANVCIAPNLKLSLFKGVIN